MVEAAPLPEAAAGGARRRAASSGGGGDAAGKGAGIAAASAVELTWRLAAVARAAEAAST